MKYARILSVLLAFTVTAQGISQSEITRKDTEEVIYEVCKLLREHYVYPDIAEKICDTLKRNLIAGKYDRAADYNVLTRILTEDLQSVNNDQHLFSYYAPPTPTPESSIVDPISTSLGFILRHKQSNFGLSRVERMAGNIGYLEILTFRPMPNPEAERIMRSAMDFLANCNALIIDLRRNGGGHINMLEFLSSYFFDRPTQLSSRYLRETGGFKESWTLTDFDDRRFVETPLFILTSKDTISAPEIFSYDLQALKRATIVGEATAGSVNSGRYFTIKNSIQLLIANGYAINPITNTHCEGKGIQPDVKVAAEQALDTCLELAVTDAGKYLEKKQSELNENIHKFRSQLADVEALTALDITDAEDTLSRVIRSWYDAEYMNPYLLLEVGDMYLKKDQLQMAIMVLKQGPIYYRGTYEMYIFFTKIAEAYQKLGDRKNAIMYLAKYLELFPNDKKMIERIRALSEESSPKKGPHLVKKGSHL